MLLFSEDQGDRFVHLSDRSLDYALAASVHMDLTLEGLVDTDRDHLVLMDYTAMGYDLLDQVLADIASSGDHKADYWVERTTDHARDIREEVLARRVARKIDDKRGGGIATYSGSTGLPRKWHRSRLYPFIEREAQQEVKVRNCWKEKSLTLGMR